jgi:hypothetical protein
VPSRTPRSSRAPARWTGCRRERAARAEVERQQQALLDASQARDGAQRQPAADAGEAQGRYERALRAQELRVFGYRLALTLPLLLLAGWLFAKAQEQRVALVWGFILFALFAFFVELVPYLPSYGGYVRYAVGIVLTVLVGRWAIAALNRYLARQQAAEAQPEQERRRELSYDDRAGAAGQGRAPRLRARRRPEGRAHRLRSHCGIGLFDRCGRCDARKSSFGALLPCLRHGGSGRSAGWLNAI